MKFIVAIIQPHRIDAVREALTEAGGLIVRSPYAPAAREGDLVNLMLLDF